MWGTCRVSDIKFFQKKAIGVAAKSLQTFPQPPTSRKGPPEYPLPDAPSPNSPRTAMVHEKCLLECKLHSHIKPLSY